MNLPAHLQNRQSRNLAEAAVAGLVGNNPPHVSIRQNRFRLVDAAGNEKPIETFHLDVVLVDINTAVSKIYYAAKFDPQATEFAPPDCFSDNGIGPSSQAQRPQAATCAACPHNVWGSEVSQVSGKQTKACNDAKKVAVIVPGMADEIVYLLRVPPASLKNLRTYAQTIATHKADLSMVVTRLSFDEQVQGVLKFTPQGWVDEATTGLIDRVWASNVTEALVGKTDKPVDPARVGQAAQAPAIPPPAAPVQRQLAPPPQPVPFSVPPAAPQAAPFAISTPVTGTQSVQAAPSASPSEPPKRRGRPPKAEAAPSQSPLPQASAPPADDALDIPPFLQRQPAPPQPKAPLAVQGMQNAPPPPSGLDEMLEKAFALPTGK